MSRIAYLLAVTAGLAIPAAAADLRVVNREPAAPETMSPWDYAFGAAITSNYIFRGVTQSNHRPSVNAYFEPRYNVAKDLQLYTGIAGNSIAFPNRAAAEIDLYGGVRRTFDKLALDLGVWYYWYPNGECFNGSIAPVFGADCLANGYLPVNGNVVKADLSFVEVFAKATFTLNEQVAIGGAVYYSPSVLNSGINGTYLAANVKLTAPADLLPSGWGAYLSGEVGHWFLGTTDQFYCTQVGLTGCSPPYANGIPYKSYTTWNVGAGVTKGILTLDFRYSDTDLNKGDCNAFTSDHTARFTADFTSINPGGFGSNWCGRMFYVTGKIDLTASANLK